MQPSFLARIWIIEGRLPLPEGQTAQETFDRLRPMLRTSGTAHHQDGDTVQFRKTDPEAQDPLSVFDHGTLRVEPAGDAGGRVLHYRMVSRILLLCFLAPLLFLGFSQLTVFVGRMNAPTAEDIAKAEKEQKAKEKKMVTPVQNPVDKFLGAPAPEKPGKDKPKPKAGQPDSKKYSPTPAYVFACFFAILYVFGRWLEARLVRRRMARLLGTDPASTSEELAALAVSH